MPLIVINNYNDNTCIHCDNNKTTILLVLNISYKMNFLTTKVINNARGYSGREFVISINYFLSIFY